MAKRIYVGGLPYSATEEDLENLFSASGAVKEVSVITDRYTGQAKGFGFGGKWTTTPRRKRPSRPSTAP